MKRRWMKKKKKRSNWIGISSTEGGFDYKTWRPNFIAVNLMASFSRCILSDCLSLDQLRRPLPPFLCYSIRFHFRCSQERKRWAQLGRTTFDVNGNSCRLFAEIVVNCKLARLFLCSFLAVAVDCSSQSTLHWHLLDWFNCESVKCKPY